MTWLILQPSLMAGDSLVCTSENRFVQPCFQPDTSEDFPWFPYGFFFLPCQTDREWGEWSRINFITIFITGSSRMVYMLTWLGYMVAMAHHIWHTDPMGKPSNRPATHPATLPWNAPGSTSTSAIAAATRASGCGDPGSGEVGTK